MSLPRRNPLLLLIIVLTLACVCTGSALAAGSHSATHRTGRSVRVCWTSTRHGKRGRHCHWRTRALHHSAKVKQAKVTVLNATPASPTSSSSTNGPAGNEAASIASVLATPCQGTELTPEAGNLASIRAATFCLINQERARQGEQPLVLNTKLESAAQSHSDEMVSADYFDHVSPNGVTPLDRLQSAGYIPGPPAGYVIGENIAWGTLNLATPSAIVAAWLASPEHLANILNAQYRDSAIGVVAAVPPSLGNGQPGAVYTQEFGVILH